MSPPPTIDGSALQVAIPPPAEWRAYPSQLGSIQFSEADFLRVVVAIAPPDDVKAALEEVFDAYQARMASAKARLDRVGEDVRLEEVRMTIEQGLDVETARKIEVTKRFGNEVARFNGISLQGVSGMEAAVCERLPDLADEFSHQIVRWRRAVLLNGTRGSAAAHIDLSHQPNLFDLVRLACEEDGELNPLLAASADGHGPSRATLALLADVLREHSSALDAILARSFQRSFEQRLARDMALLAGDTEGARRAHKLAMATWREVFDCSLSASTRVVEVLRERNAVVPYLWTERFRRSAMPDLFAMEATEWAYKWLRSRPDVSEERRGALDHWFLEYLAAREPLADRLFYQRLRIHAELSPLFGDYPANALPPSISEIEARRAALARRAMEGLKAMLAPDERIRFDQELASAGRRAFAGRLLKFLPE